MIYRELQFERPAVMLCHWLQEHRHIIRPWPTNSRGRLCIVGEGFAWAICELVSCEPLIGSVERFIWRLSDVRELSEPLLYRGSLRQSDGELPMCSAFLQAKLNELFPDAPPEYSAAPDVQLIEPTITHAGQLEMFA